MMTTKHLTTTEAARRLGHRGTSWLTQLAAAGRIPGAEKHGRDWMIPAAALADLRRLRAGRPQGRTAAR